MIEVTQVSVAEGIRYAIFGKRFATNEEAVAYRDEVIAKRAALLGREPTVRELIAGPVKVDNRTSSEKAHDMAWKVVTGEEEAVDLNPYRKQKPAPKSFREGVRQKYEKAWDQRAEAAEQQAERDADPERQRAIAWATERLEKAVWSPNTTRADVVAAERLLAQAKTGCLQHFKSMADPVAQKEVDAFVARRAEIENHLLAERALLDSMAPPKNYDGVPGVGPNGRVSRQRGYGPDGKYGVEEVVVLDGNRIVKTYPLDQCPPEILALAPTNN